MPVGCYTVGMDTQDIERRLQEIERTLELGKQKRQERRGHVEAVRKRRNFHSIIGRVFALALAYPFIALFLWFIDTPSPWVHALTPAITIFMFTLVTNGGEVGSSVWPFPVHLQIKLGCW